MSPSTDTTILTLGLIPFITGALAGLTTCPSNIPFSCQNTTAVNNECCFNSPGGLLVQTQFWDTDPATGPEDSWTIHGLWPDNCDGTYKSTPCDPSRSHTNITSILSSQNRSSLLSYMQTYWVDINGDNEKFWSHEWSKHGTCINTIRPSCYDPSTYTPQEEVGDFFGKVVDLFKGLDTYKALEGAGITPSSSSSSSDGSFFGGKGKRDGEEEGYDLADIENALSKIHNGKKPQVMCENGSLNQVYYYFNVRGNAIDGVYEAVDAVGSSNCPSTGISYPSKNSGQSQGGW